MRRTAAVLGLLVLACSAPALARPPATEEAASAARSWAAPQIAAVVAAGLMGPDVALFRPDGLVTRGELYDALVAAGRPASPPADPARPVTIRELDAKLVSALGLSAAARTIRLAARDAGLEPTQHLGTETVARLLGLRLDHPRAREYLEPAPSQPATRAEAAYSLARLLKLGEPAVRALAAQAQSFALPELSEWQRVVLARALRLVGHPYVWAGASERPQLLYDGSAPGGFDCSGLVWGVFKSEPLASAPALSDTIRGRTTYVMSGEVPTTLRLALDALAPGDLVFFGPRGPRSSPRAIGHMGIYVGGGWFVHSSVAGVTLQPLAGSYLERFAWGRSPLAEAGLV